MKLLQGDDASRVPELLPIRYGRMAVSAFTFFRGAALPMAADLAGTPRSGLVAQICGDAHLANFGVFASPERRLVFDINDFDETLPGPWEWDIKRLATSLEVAGRDNGYSTKQRRSIVLAAVAAYRNAMAGFAEKTALEVWYAHADEDAIKARFEEAGRGRSGRKLDASQRKRAARTMAKARTKDNLGALGRFAGGQDGRPAIVADPPLIVPIRDLVEDGTDPAELQEQLQGMIDAYRSTLEPERQVLLDQYRLADFARKVVGVGSVGTRSWMALLLGDHERDPLFLQAKEAGPSALEQFVAPSEYDNAGQRVVVGQRLMQAVSDIFLGWVRVKGIDGQTRDFYLRQLRDWKGSAEIEADGPGRDADLRRTVRVDTRPRTRPLRGPHRDRGLPRLRSRLRRGARRVRTGLRRPERARLPGADGRHPVRAGRGRDWAVAAMRGDCRAHRGASTTSSPFGRASFCTGGCR